VSEEQRDLIRHSEARDAELILDPDEKAAAEARNGLLQIDKAIEIVEYYTQNNLPFKLRPSHLLQLHRTALAGISAYAGVYRPSSIEIGKSKHEPPGAHIVPELVEDLCEYINSNWAKNAIHLSAYVLWQLNWIHPFTDGNGRTARAGSYLVLCTRLGYPLYGRNTIPAQIQENRRPYYEALEAADENHRLGIGNPVTKLEELLDMLLARQIYSVLNDARGH
jgi:Fic family protein